MITGSSMRGKKMALVIECFRPKHFNSLYILNRVLDIPKLAKILKNVKVATSQPFFKVKYLSVCVCHKSLQI
jgi:hypothetical protein